MDRKPCFICRAHGAPAPYPNAVCSGCEGRARSPDGRPVGELRYPEGEGPKDEGPFDDDGINPVFIDDVQCWRRYRFGGWVTMADPEGYATLEEFYGRESSRRP